MKLEKVKLSETTCAEIQKIKHDTDMQQDEDVINMLIQYYNDPLFHISEEFKFELMKIMDKQSEENKVENIEEMIYKMIEEIKQNQ